MSTSVNVVVVGAGPVGLTAGLLLARDGVTVLIVERRGGTSVLPRATGVNARSMEIFRSLGLERAIAAVSLSADGGSLLLAGESLVAPARTTIASTRFQYAAADWPSPTNLSWCAQDQLEPVLVAAVGAQPTAQLRFGTELASLSDRGDRVTATLRDTTRDDTDTVEADYLIGAGGSQTTSSSTSRRPEGSPAKASTQPAAGVDRSIDQRIGAERTRLKVRFEAGGRGWPRQ